MPTRKALATLGASLVVAAALPFANAAVAADRAAVEAAVNEAFQPLMRRLDIPGMAVGVAMPEGNYVFNYGVASRQTKRPVDDATLFELGSVSKTFAATLGAYAAETNRMALADSATKYLPALRGSALDGVTLADLATHTSGGMPLQVPDGIDSEAQLTAYLRNWKPARQPGTVRTYSNVSIGLFGLAVGASLGTGFQAAMETRLFPALGLSHSYLAVPEAERAKYAQGYTRRNEPTRMAPGPLAIEAYGMRATAGDLVRFAALNMALLPLDPVWQRALQATHTGYDRIGATTQDLVWEQYAWPAKLDDLLAGNSSRMALEPGEVVPIEPPQPPRGDVVINKTGSTSGFSAYVAFVPNARIGIVMLANRNFPNEDRVRAAHAVLTALEKAPAKR